MKKLIVEYKKLKTNESRLVPEWNYLNAMDEKMEHMPATQSPAIVDSGNYLDEQHSQWSPDMLDNLLSSSLSHGGQSSSASTKQSMANQSGQVHISNSSNLIRNERDPSLMLLET